MNENEIMVNEEITKNPEVEEETTESSGVGLGMIIGGITTLGAIWVGKKVKKIIDKKKAAKEVSTDGEVIEVDEINVQNDPEVKK